MWNFGRASDDEALRLVVAYLNISEPERRREVIELAERYRASSSPIVVKIPPLRQDNQPEINPALADDA